MVAALCPPYRSRDSTRAGTVGEESTGPSFVNTAPSEPCGLGVPHSPGSPCGPGAPAGHDRPSTFHCSACSRGRHWSFPRTMRMSPRLLTRRRWRRRHLWPGRPRPSRKRRRHADPGYETCVRSMSHLLAHSTGRGRMRRRGLSLLGAASKEVVALGSNEVIQGSRQSRSEDAHDAHQNCPGCHKAMICRPYGRSGVRSSTSPSHPHCWQRKPRISLPRGPPSADSGSAMRSAPHR